MPGRARPPSLPAARRERVDLTEGPVHGRVGRHVAEQTLLGPQRLDVRARLAAPTSISIACTRTLPRSWTGNRSPAGGLPATAPLPDSAGPRTTAGRAARHGPPRRRHPPRSLPAACCYGSPARCPSRSTFRCVAPTRMPCWRCPVASCLPHVISWPRERSVLVVFLIVWVRFGVITHRCHGLTAP